MFKFTPVDIKNVVNSAKVGEGVMYRTLVV